MTNTRKLVATAALGAALALSAAAPALAATPAQSRAVDLNGVADTVCVNYGSATAEGIVFGSPGVLSGNQIQIPINIPINICGNSVNILGVG